MHFKIINITEVPDQTLLEAIAENNPQIRSIQRQIQVDTVQQMK